MIEIFKRFYWMVTSKEGFRALRYALVRELPGPFGSLVRRRVMVHHFARAGVNLEIFEGVRFRNPERISCGDNVRIGNDVMLQAGGGLTVGNNVILGPGVKIWTQTHRHEDSNVPILEQGYEYGPVVIGEDCWIGANAFIMPGVKLPRGCVISAGALVGVKNYSDFSILMGNPARVIGYREAGADQRQAPAIPS